MDNTLNAPFSASFDGKVTVQTGRRANGQTGRHKGIKAAAKLLRETTRQLSMQSWKSRRSRLRWRRKLS